MTTYKIWHACLPHIGKAYRQSICAKIDLLLVEVLELIFIASYLPKTTKLPLIEKAILRLDVLKFFLQTLWEVKALDTKKYVLVFESADEAGKKLGGWKNQLSGKTPMR